MDKNKNYTLAVALLNFKAAYTKLTNAAAELPDLDVSEGYPFFMLDFEEIAPAVYQWCNIHAAKLMRDLPMIIKNPACTGCIYNGAGVTAGGLCVGAQQIGCNTYPEILYQRHIAVPKLTEAGIDTTDMNDDEIHFMYLNKIDKMR